MLINDILIGIGFDPANFCGDGTKGVLEECDDGNEVNNDDCTNACKLPKCGDGIVTSSIGEACDDENLIDGDGCSATCTIEGSLSLSPTKNPSSSPSKSPSIGPMPMTPTENVSCSPSL